MANEVDKDKLRLLLDELNDEEQKSLRAMINGRLSAGKPRPNRLVVVKQRRRAEEAKKSGEL